VFGSGPSTSLPIVQLVVVSNEVRALIFDGMFDETSRVLTLVATHYPDLHFMAICRGYVNGWSTDEIHALGESLVLHTQVVTEPVTAQWLMEARYSTMAVDVCREDIVQPMEAAEARSKASIIPSPSEQNVVSTAAEPSTVVPTIAELPSSSPTAPSTDTTGGPQELE